MDKARFSSTRYVVALILVAAAVFTRWLLAPYVANTIPFAFLMLALVVISASSGYGPGLLALTIGGLATVFFIIEPIKQFRITALPLQLTVGAYFISGLMVIALGEAFRRARFKALDYETALGNGFKETGEVYVRTVHGLRLLRTHPVSEGRTAAADRAELPLDRIISEIIPSLSEIIDTPNWQILADGKPVANIVLRPVPRREPSSPKNWVVTEIIPVAPGAASGHSA